MRPNANNTLSDHNQNATNANINMTLGELLSKKSARNSSLDNSNAAIQIDQDKQKQNHVEGTPVVYARRVDENTRVETQHLNDRP